MRYMKKYKTKSYLVTNLIIPIINKLLFNLYPIIDVYECPIV